MLQFDWEKRGEGLQQVSADSVGWRLYGDWKDWRQYSNPLFTPRARIGHLLPLHRFSHKRGVAVGWTSSIPPKLVDCACRRLLKRDRTPQP
jgi:hypothetical protein